MPLLSAKQPGHDITEVDEHTPVSSDQGEQTATSPTINQDDNDTPGNADDDDEDGLVDYDMLLPQGLRNGSVTRAPPARETEESEERPKKRPRID